MWFEILPSFGIIVAAMSAPHFTAYVINKMVVGTYYRRSLHDIFERTNYVRDTRLGNGDPYRVVGLEGIPDK